jgi:hypothetical protein
LIDRNFRPCNKGDGSSAIPHLRTTGEQKMTTQKQVWTKIEARSPAMQKHVDAIAKAMVGMADIVSKAEGYPVKVIAGRFGGYVWTKDDGRAAAAKTGVKQY